MEFLLLANSSSLQYTSMLNWIRFYNPGCRTQWKRHALTGGRKTRLQMSEKKHSSFRIRIEVTLICIAREVWASQHTLLISPQWPTLSLHSTLLNPKTKAQGLHAKHKQVARNQGFCNWLNLLTWFQGWVAISSNLIHCTAAYISMPILIYLAISYPGVVAL